ncbi:hypothetical protein [Metabacillus litoralis]|uniref:hypothetical protein n=1 Tax=Metabacillus litoralis TaxID=152268 RepID=UPI001CFCB3C9|nr:hypothetical protein [Metabacillus litoralis]
MSTFRTIIGEHVFEFWFTTNDLEEKLLSQFKPLESDDKIPDIKISLHSNYGKSFLNYEVEISKSDSMTLFKRADYLIEVDNDYEVCKMFVHNELAFKHALMNLYSSFIVHHNWGILLHSSCVIDNNGACVFSGQSGAGKSTAARLSQPRELLSDEATLIRITEDDITVFDSPFRSELNSTHNQNTYSLKSIDLLNQSPVNKRNKLTKSDGFLLLLDKVFFWTSNKEEVQTILMLLSILTRKVPMYSLHFQKNNTFWELIS